MFSRRFGKSKHRKETRGDPSDHPVKMLLVVQREYSERRRRQSHPVPIPVPGRVPQTEKQQQLEKRLLQEKYVDLQNQKLSLADLRVVAAALKNTNTLEKLYLRDNNIGAAGAKEIANALRDNNTLEKL